MHTSARLFVAVLGLALFLYVLERIRRRRMRIEYSVLWFVMSLGALLLAILPDLFDHLARWVGIEYPPALYFLVAILLLFLILLHVSAELTYLREQNKTLIQQVSLLRERARARDEDEASRDR